jgi:hypothetical protein
MQKLGLLLVISLLPACADGNTIRRSEPPPVRSFTEAVAFLRDHGDVQVLDSPGGGVVAVSARYQGRVMTSAVAPEAPALGWINYDFIRAAEVGTQFDNYGGEDRFWLGPEGGQYGLYFPPGSGFTFAAWQVPAALQEGAWAITDQSATSITFATPMRLTSHGGTAFELDVQRTVRLLSGAEVEAAIGVEIPASTRWVAYETVNRVTNTGDRAWEKGSGLPSIWILSMLNPFDSAYVVIPLQGSSPPVVNDEYFGKVPSDRLVVRDDHLVFLGDGQYRSKIGIGPEHSKPVMGAFIPSQQLLTLVQFTLPSGATDYVNSMWEIQTEPYRGDVINSYNDGPVAPGEPPLGGFYELESSSPALELARGESYTHVHRTVHIVGAPDVLDRISTAAMGVAVSPAASTLPR